MLHIIEVLSMLPTSTVGRKLLMTISGQLMVIFVIFHVLGNSTIYVNWLNAYAAGLRAFPPFLWALRLLMIASVLFHVYLGIVVTLENRASKPQVYAVTNHLSTTFAGRNMIWSGASIFSFLIYHLLQFTFQVTDPAIAAVRNLDAAGRPDVLSMVVQSFQHISTVLVYLVSLAALLLHLTHGIQSSFQTWGLNSDRSLAIMIKAGTMTAVALFLGYVAIPLVILLGILR
jgi:succinate dehydrogenase / fumarate reductase cytochrome b subunit